MPASIQVHKYSLCVLVAIVIYMLAVVTFAGQTWLIPNAIGAFIGLLVMVFNFYALPYIVRFLLHLAIKVRPDRPRDHVFAALSEFAADKARVAHFCVVMLIFAGVAVMFTLSKAVIPQIIPFAHDALFANMDRLIFGGIYPHEFFNWLYPSGWAMQLVSLVYQTWLWVFLFTIGYCAYSLYGQRLAAVYLFAMVFTLFIGGNVLALLGSSAGPAFIELHSMDVYGSARSFMQTNEIMASGLQDKLWIVQTNMGVSSISAFPSMHVATTTLVLLLARQTSKTAALWGWAFWIAINLGSVILLWHYAVDSIAGALIALFAWWLGQKITPKDTQSS